MQAKERDSGNDVSQMYLNLVENNHFEQTFICFVCVFFSSYRPEIFWFFMVSSCKLCPGIFRSVDMYWIYREMYRLSCLSCSSGAKSLAVLSPAQKLPFCGSGPLCWRIASVGEKEIQKPSRALSQLKLLLVQISFPHMVLFSVVVSCSDTSVPSSLLNYKRNKLFYIS